MTFADPKSDIAFKKVFGNENKTEILICFLNAVLDLHDEQAIVEITILNPYQAPKISILKESNLDVRAETQGGVTFIVEMQVEKQDYFAKRALYYTAGTVEQRLHPPHPLPGGDYRLCVRRKPAISHHYPPHPLPGGDILLPLRRHGQHSYPD